MNYPRIYLAIDNCFAYKRWTRPFEWAQIIKELGVNYIEASADTELDPFYMGEEYLKDWVIQVKESEEKHGVKVANLYSGHGSYTTLGLAHYDSRVKRRMIDGWFKKLIDIAAELGAGFGFFAHGFADFVLQDKATYELYHKSLTDSLSELALYAKRAGVKKIGVEQMYAPHHAPWRIKETHELLSEIKNRDADFYFTEDVGHHSRKFIKPDKASVFAALKHYDRGVESPDIWLGTDRAYQLFDRAKNAPGMRGDLVEELMAEMDDAPHMFCGTEDSDCYIWIEKLGCYSPIIHLQQTDGNSSSHLQFTEENNAKGIIKAEKLLAALKECYDREPEPDMPARCDEIYLTLEAFTPTASINRKTLSDYKKSVAYWRKRVPEDGLLLDDLTKRLGKER